MDACTDAPDPAEELKRCLESAGSIEFLHVLQKEGVVRVSDIKDYFDLTHLKSLGLNHIQAAKALRLNPT